MTDSPKSALITWTTGDRDKPPVVLLHDRYLDRDAADPLALALAPTHRIVAARAARTQMEMGLIKGYYWFLGPLERPELSTFGDGLHHLERLLLSLNAETGRKVALIGRGEGGAIALVLALVWHELVSGVVSIDGPLPTTLHELPLDIGLVTGLPELLVEQNTDPGSTAAALAARGAAITRIAADDTAIARWIGDLA